MGERTGQGRRPGARGPHDLPGFVDGRDQRRQLVARARLVLHECRRGRSARGDGPGAAPALGHGAHGRAFRDGDAHRGPRGPSGLGRTPLQRRRARGLLRLGVRHGAVLRLAVRQRLPAGHVPGLPELALQVQGRRPPRAHGNPRIFSGPNVGRRRVRLARVRGPRAAVSPHLAGGRGCGTSRGRLHQRRRQALPSQSHQRGRLLQGDHGRARELPERGHLSGVDGDLRRALRERVPTVASGLRLQGHRGALLVRTQFPQERRPVLL